MRKIITRYPLPVTRSGQPAGFTLVGTIVALFIAVTTVILVVQLMTRAQVITDIGRERFIAANLAREGLELVRQVRDNNWFTSDTNANWLARGLCDSAGDNNHQFTLDSDRAAEGRHVGDVEAARLYRQAGTGLWLHQISDEVTLYSRVLSIDCTTSEGDPQYITVTSAVTWSSRGQDREVIVKEKLFNWLPGESDV